MLLSTFAATTNTRADGGTRPEARSSRAAAPAAALLGDWPAGRSPQEVGRRVIANYLARALPAGEMHYAEACTWYGALTTARLTGDAALSARLVQRFDPILTPPSRAPSPIIPSRAHVDDRVFGIVPLEIFVESGDPRYLALGRDLADKQWAAPTADGISAEARYWIDDMWMITSLQAQAFRATGDVKYRDRAARTMVAYLDRLQQPNGLFFHTARSPQHWARGNGWFAAGMTELLRALPADHPQRARILAGYQKMMAALLQHQTEAGLWRQLIDHPEAWVEASGSAMFTYAFISGVKNGWLPAATYGAPARKAWLGLVGYLDAQANLTDVCVGTGEAFTTTGPDARAQVRYYLERPRSVGDFHGQAPVLWSASALLR
jgi:rhamnogalacturonyl hydrolase YesR